MLRTYAKSHPITFLPTTGLFRYYDREAAGEAHASFRTLRGLRQAAFFDELEAHQVTKVPYRFLVVAVENHPMQQRHHAALDCVLAPIQEKPPGIGYALRELGPTRQRAGAGFQDLARRDQHGVEVDELGARHRLADAVLHLQRHTAFAVSLRADREGQPPAGRAVHLRGTRAVE